LLETSILAIDGIRTLNSTRRTAADTRLSPCGQRGWRS